VTVQGEGLDPRRHRKTNSNTGSIVMRSIKKTTDKAKGANRAQMPPQGCEYGRCGINFVVLPGSL